MIRNVFCVLSICCFLISYKAASGQSTRTFSGATGAAWTSVSNWTPSGTFAGSAPVNDPAGEGQSTDIMTTLATNTATKHRD